MANDQYGREIHVGDPVSIQGKVESLTGDPNGANCTVRLNELMPPSGAETRIVVNTAQIVNLEVPPEPGAREPEPPPE